VRTLAIHRSRIYCVRQTVPICVWRAGLVPCYCNNSSTADSSGRCYWNGRGLGLGWITIPAPVPASAPDSWFWSLLTTVADCDRDAFPAAPAPSADDVGLGLGWGYGFRVLDPGGMVGYALCRRQFNRLPLTKLCCLAGVPTSPSPSPPSPSRHLLLSQGRVHVWLLQMPAARKTDSTTRCLLLMLLLRLQGISCTPVTRLLEIFALKMCCTSFFFYFG